MRETERQWLKRLEMQAAFPVSTKPSWAERCGFHGNVPDYGCYTCRTLIDRWRPRKAHEMGGWARTRTLDEEQRGHQQELQRYVADVREYHELLAQQIGHRQHHPLPVPPPEPDYAGGRHCQGCGSYTIGRCRICWDQANEDRRKALESPAHYP